MMLEMKGVSASYDAVQAIRDVSLEVNEGEIVCLIGANGAGKSTTLKVISGLLRPNAGEVIFEGKQIQKTKPEEIVRLGISHVPEGRRVLPGLTVRENLELSTSVRKSLSKADLNKEIEHQYELFPDLGRLRNALGWTLSGGQQQMLGIARGLMARPKMLMMDEPSLGLAPIIVKQVLETTKRISKEFGTTVLLVEQNASMALSISNRGYVMETGRITMSGTSKELLSNPQVNEAYLGGRSRKLKG